MFFSWTFNQFVVVLLIFASLACSFRFGKKQEFILEDEHFIRECDDKSTKYLKPDAFLDFSNVSFTMEGETVKAEGNVTCVWDVKPTDRVEVQLSIYKMDKGVWQPTIYSFNIKDFCPVMYNKNELPYKIYSQYIINDVQDKCYNNPGTILQFKPFEMHIEFPQFLAMSEGRYRLRLWHSAFGQPENVKRPNVICFDIHGTLYLTN